MRHAHIIMQDADAAETRNGLRSRRFDRVGVGDIRRDRDGVSALLHDDGSRLLRRLLDEIDTGDPCAFARIGYRRRLAVAPAGARGTGPEHDGRLVLQAINH